MRRSRYLNVPIRKLRGDHCFTFLPSADDPEVALFHNDAVAQERIRFYVSHMRQGWPKWDTATTSSARTLLDTSDHGR